jgi:His-Xaa-Ser repeat protein HxsA
LPEHAADERLSPKKFSETAKRVQRALAALGYYNGAIDGIVGRGTRAAISLYQIDFQLSVTGTITPELLDSLGIK